MKGRYWLIGFLIGCAIIAIVIIESTHGKGMDVFFHLSGLLLVFGGTLATAFIAWPPNMVLANFKVILLVLRKQVLPPAAVLEEVVRVASETGGDLRALEAALPGIQHPFFKDSVQLLIDRVDVEHMEFILRERIRQNKLDYDSVAGLVKGLAKYPPAFGMIGTLVGLVALMRGLGSSVGAGNLGSAMAIGLVATFYGVAFANLVLMPMGDNITYKSAKEIQNRNIIAKGILLMKAGESAVLLQEALNSMVKFSERVDVLGLGGEGKKAPGKKVA